MSIREQRMSTRYVYIVTRVVTDPACGIPIPNLGVFSNMRAAVAHFDLVKQSRLSAASRLLWDIRGEDRRTIRKALLDNGSNEREELRIERWSV